MRVRAWLVPAGSAVLGVAAFVGVLVRATSDNALWVRLCVAGYLAAFYGCIPWLWRYRRGLLNIGKRLWARSMAWRPAEFIGPDLRPISPGATAFRAAGCFALLIWWGLLWVGVLVWGLDGRAPGATFSVIWLYSLLVAGLLFGLSALTERPALSPGRVEDELDVG